MKGNTVKYLKNVFALVVISGFCVSSLHAGQFKTADCMNSYDAFVSSKQKNICEAIENMRTLFPGEIMQHKVNAVAKLSQLPEKYVHHDLAKISLVRYLEYSNITLEDMSLTLRSQMVDTLFKAVQNKRISKKEAELIYQGLQFSLSNKDYYSFLKQFS